MAAKARKKGASSRKKASPKKKAASKKKVSTKSVSSRRRARPRKTGGYREGEPAVDLEVTLDGEPRAATLSRIGRRADQPGVQGRHVHRDGALQVGRGETFVKRRSAWSATRTSSRTGGTGVCVWTRSCGAAGSRWPRLSFRSWIASVSPCRWRGRSGSSRASTPRASVARSRGSCGGAFSFRRRTGKRAATSPRTGEAPSPRLTSTSPPGTRRTCESPGTRRST